MQHTGADPEFLNRGPKRTIEHSDRVKGEYDEYSSIVKLYFNSYTQQTFRTIYGL